MTYSPTSRDRARLAVAAVSGLTTVAAIAATGWVAGTVAQSAATDQPAPSTQTSQARNAGAHAAKHRPRVVLKQRPQRTQQTVRYVRGAPSAPVGTGGTVSQPVRQPAVTHTPAAPAPAPAPSSGS